jgi:hypothetical protein
VEWNAFGVQWPTPVPRGQLFFRFNGICLQTTIHSGHLTEVDTHFVRIPRVALKFGHARSSVNATQVPAENQTRCLTEYAISMSWRLS